MSAPDSAATPDPRLGSAAWLNAPETVRVFDVIEAAGFAVRAVGGTVRNTLLGEPVSDIDLATDAPPETVMAAAQRAGLKVVPTGIAHGTVTIVVDGIPFEVTTLRRDVTTDGRRATIAYTGDWTADAMRRDFTINALYCDRRGALFDPVGGIDDIAQRRVRFIGQATERIREDYLRILRFFRFSATYAGGRLDAAGLAACEAERAGLARLSAERIHHELMRVLCARHARAVVEVMHARGFLADLLAPPAPDIDAFVRLVEIETALCANDASMPEADALLRLAALAVHSAEDVALIKTRLRLSNAEARRMELALRATAQLHGAMSEQALRACAYRNGTAAAIDGLKLAAARSAKPDAVLARAHPMSALAAAIAALEAWTPPRLPVTGTDVLARGVPPGPRVAAILGELEDGWIAAGFPEDPGELARRLDALVPVTRT